MNFFSEVLPPKHVCDAYLVGSSLLAVARTRRFSHVKKFESSDSID